MKKNQFILRSLTIVIFSYLLLICCSRKETNGQRPTGKLDLNVGISVITQGAYSDLKATLADFVAFIYNDRDEVVESFDSAEELPDVIELPEDSYYVVAHTNNNLPAEFENPYYYGISSPFNIIAGETTPVSLTCTLANIMVSVVYSDNVISDFSGYSTSVSSTSGTLIFDMDETRAGYFSHGPLSIEANLYYTDGGGILQSVNLTGEISYPQPQVHYEIHIDASLSEGSSVIELIIDETIETVIVSVSDEDPSLGTVAPGDLLITEIMYNPSALSDAEGEWFEVYNNSVKTLNLIDLVIRRGSNNDLHRISSDLIISPSEYVVLAISGLATDNVDYPYGPAISLTNTGYELFINEYGTDGTDGTVICSVDYSAVNFNTGLNGSSLQLDPSVTNVEDARDGLNWCAGTTPYSTGDNGTPGEVNITCE